MITSHKMSVCQMITSHKMIVCVTEGRREGARDGGRHGRAESGGMAAKTLEPHTEMWGTKLCPFFWRINIYATFIDLFAPQVG